MGRKTGNPRGRPKGAKSQRTIERERKVEAAAKALEGLLPEAFKGDAHAFLMAVYKDTSNPIKDRLAAATAAIGYEKPKLAAVEHSGGMTLTHEQALEELEKAEAEMNGHESAH